MIGFYVIDYFLIMLISYGNNNSLEKLLFKRDI